MSEKYMKVTINTLSNFLAILYIMFERYSQNLYTIINNNMYLSWQYIATLSRYIIIMHICLWAIYNRILRISFNHVATFSVSVCIIVLYYATVLPKLNKLVVLHNVAKFCMV